MEVNDLCALTTVIRKNWCIGTRATAARGAEEKISSGPNTDSDTIKVSQNNWNQYAQCDDIR